MGYEIEFVKVISSSYILIRTKDQRLADRYYMGEVYLTFSDCKTYYCISYQEIDGYYYMRMVTE